MDGLMAGRPQECPTCGRHAQVYRRSIHANVAMQLIELYRLGGEHEFIHIKKISESIGRRMGRAYFHNGGEFSITKHWGLTISSEKAKEDHLRRMSGMWKLTEDGVLFVTNHALIRKFAHTFDNALLMRDGDFINIIDALGVKFDYHKLMQPEGVPT